MKLIKKTIVPVLLCLTLCSCGGQTEPTTFSVNLFSNNEIAGRLSGNGNYTKGAKVTIMANVNNGYKFLGWFSDASYNVLVTSKNEYTFSVENALSFYAKFDFEVYSITYELNGGVNNPKNPNSYNVENEFLFENPTFENHNFINWTKNGTPITGITKGSTGNITLTANWSDLAYKVNISINDSTRGTVEGGGEHFVGSDVTITAKAQNDFAFEGWYSDKDYTLKIGQLTTYHFVMPRENVQIYAKFVTYEEQNEWNINHGIIPYKVDDEHYTYGLYPQKHVNDENIIHALNKLQPEEGVYTWYDGEYYVKAKASPAETNYKFYDETDIKQDFEYYFQCEPIIGKIVLESDTSLTFDSSYILDMKQFNKEKENNVYKGSVLQRWLIEDFYNTAFQFDSSYIKEREIENIIDFQTIWAGSHDEYKENGEWKIQGNANRKKKITDYALCIGAGIFETLNEKIYYGNYWTRSIHATEKNRVSVIGFDYDKGGTGSDSQSAWADELRTGVAPCFLINRAALDF